MGDNEDLLTVFEDPLTMRLTKDKVSNVGPFCDLNMSFQCLSFTALAAVPLLPDQMIIR
jgi:hypothetical protein